MTSYNDTNSLLQDLLTGDNSNNRIKALVLRLLIQCNEHKPETRKEYVDQLIEMGRGNPDHRWAVWRSLRNHLRLDPLPPDVERRFINDLAGQSLKDFEWRDVQIQAAQALGDVQDQLRDAIDLLATAFQNSSDAIVRRYHVESILKVAERMDKKQRDAGPFSTIMLAALKDDSPDVRARACEALNTVLKPKAATELVVDSLLQQDPPFTRLVEALRNIDGKRASSILKEYLFHPNPEVKQRASDALLQLGGDLAFSALFAQRQQAIEQYTDILNDADERIMGQYNLLMQQARLAFWISLLMHGLIFVVGLVLIGSAVWNGGLLTTDSLQGLVGVGGGFLGIYFGHFYRNPVFTLDEMKETVNQIHVVVDQSLEKIQTYLAIADSSSPGATIRQMSAELSADAARAGLANAIDT